MPRLSMNYLRTKIYKIVCKDLTIKHTYVGHTTQWTDRKSHHKSDCRNENSKNHNFPVYIFIRNNGGWDNWDMILIEDYPCENKLQAEQRERYWIETLNANLNISIPTRNKKEYYEDNREYILQRTCQHYRENENEKKQYNNEYRRENKQKIKQHQNEKFECECGGKYMRCHLLRHQRTKKHQDYVEQKEADPIQRFRKGFLTIIDPNNIPN
jgi:hypothetical protein